MQTAAISERPVRNITRRLTMEFASVLPITVISQTVIQCRALLSEGLTGAEVPAAVEDLARERLSFLNSASAWT